MRHLAQGYVPDASRHPESDRAEKRYSALSEPLFRACSSHILGRPRITTLALLDGPTR